MKRRSLFCVAAMLFTAACGDDPVDSLTGDGGILPGGEDAAPVTVDVPEDNDEVLDLDDDEEATICDELPNAVNEGVSATTKCNVGGAAKGSVDIAMSGGGEPELQEACKEFVDSCSPAAGVANAQIPEIKLGECPVFKGDTSACAKPIETLKSCLNHVGQTTADSLKNVDCDNLSLDKAAELAGGAAYAGLDTLKESAACAELIAECPGIFEAGGGSPDGGAPDGGAGGADGGS